MGDGNQFARVILSGKLKYTPGAKVLPGNKKSRCEAQVVVGEFTFTLVAYDELAQQLDGKDRGTQVHCVGRLKTLTWQTQMDGERSRVVVEVDAMRFTQKFVVEDVP